jgi:hypothetical protein
MRPDAEPRQPHGSPTSAPSAPAPNKRGGGGRVLVGLGAVVLLVGSAAAGLAGGVLHGAASIQPRESGAAPDRAEERAEAAAPEETGERVEYRGMSVLLPEGWAAETVTDEFGSNTTPPSEAVAGEWTVLYPEGQDGCDGHEWSWTDTGTGCAHLKILGPQGIQYGSGILSPIELSTGGPSTAFRPSDNATLCPEGVITHTEADPGFRGIGQWDTTEDKAGEEPAGYTEGSAACLDPATGGLAYVDQRLWFIEGAEILVVDGYGLDEAEAVVASAEW